MGIHYDYKSTKSAKLMEKQAKRERKLAEKKAKREAKEGIKKEETNSANMRSTTKAWKKEPRMPYSVERGGGTLTISIM